MSDEARRCGTCRWWELRDPQRQLGWCNHPIPDCVNEDEVKCMYDQNGTNCPCWAKEGDDER